MSHPLIALNQDLRKLEDEGFDLEILGEATLAINSIPYIDSEGKVLLGQLCTKLDLAGSATTPPREHIAFFVGSLPHDESQVPIPDFQPSTKVLGGGVTANFTVSRHAGSQSAPSNYLDYHHKMTTYVALIENANGARGAEFKARDIDKAAFIKAHQSPFLFPDTASVHAGLNQANECFNEKTVAIVGLGGTGSFVLDLISKTQVREIRLFDHDEFLNHNAFRSPGSVTEEEVSARSNKATFYANKYSSFRTGVIAHSFAVDSSCLKELTGVDFVFICIDDPASKSVIFKYLEENKIAFIDVGMGLYQYNSQVGGQLRVSLISQSISQTNRSPIELEVNRVRDEYETNIQVVELNALNASLAVIQWKKHLGFYAGTPIPTLIYQVDGNIIIHG